MSDANTIGIKFLYSFLVGEYDLNNPGSNITSITSFRQGHEAINLTTTPLRESWRSIDVTGWQEIVIKANDLTETPDTFAILNHNLSKLAVVQLQGSMTSDFSAPAFTFSFTWTKKNMVLLQDVGAKYRYYRFRFLDPTNGCGYIEIGKIIGGLSFTMTKDEDITDDITVTPDDKAYKTPTEGFFRAFNQRVIVDKLQIKFEKLLTSPDEDSNWQGLLELMSTVGETFPFLTIVDPFDQAFNITWGVIDTLPARMFGINRYVNMNLAIQEVL
jgi:hypothetical protein